MMVLFLTVVLLLSSFAFSAFSISFYSKWQVYDMSPRLYLHCRVCPQEFTGDIYLSLHSPGQADLVSGVDFTVTVVKGSIPGLSLKIHDNKKWAVLNESYSAYLTIADFKYGESGEEDNDHVSVGEIVATVIQTPSIAPSVQELIQTSHVLHINGTGLLNATKVDMYFVPPLYKEVSYEIISKFPLEQNSVTLQLRYGYMWRSEPGSLRVIGVDTGGGPVKVNGDDGVEVAHIAPGTEVSLYVSQSTEQIIYTNSSRLVIRGQAFNRTGLALKFQNGLNKSIDYSIESVSYEEIVLQLLWGKSWMPNAAESTYYATLGQSLVLTSIKVGNSEYFGPVNSRKGIVVAIVHRIPEVFSSSIVVKQSLSHILTISGRHFSFKTELSFEPYLERNRDYVLMQPTTLADGTEQIRAMLMSGHKWRAAPGALQVVSVNTIGAADGWIPQRDGGVTVATVVDDRSDVSGLVSVLASVLPKYQSSPSLSIWGSGLELRYVLEFEPPLFEGLNYTKEALQHSNNKAGYTLKLRRNNLWADRTVILTLVGVRSPDKPTVNLLSERVMVARILENPAIKSSIDTVIHNHQTKRLKIVGSGLELSNSITLRLSPTSSSAYKVLRVSPYPGDYTKQEVTLGLTTRFEGWSPSGPGKALTVTSVDTGAGDFQLPLPVIVGYVVNDLSGVLCDDSCEFSLDGVCDSYMGPHKSAAFHPSGQRALPRRRLGHDDDAEADDNSGADDATAADDYYASNSEDAVTACVQGTDCNDCGGVEAMLGFARNESGMCLNTCSYPRDGVCDDPRGAGYCEMGTDCMDCGPVGASNFSTNDDDDNWKDDDENSLFIGNSTILNQTGGLSGNIDKIIRVYSPPPVFNDGRGTIHTTTDYLDDFVAFFYFVVASVVLSVAGLVCFQQVKRRRARRTWDRSRQAYAAVGVVDDMDDQL